MRERLKQGMQAREGFTLIEVIVAMVLLSTVLVMLAGMTFVTAQRSMDLQSSGTRQAMMLQAVNWLTAVDYDDLATHEGCRTIAAADGDSYQACITLLTVAGNTRSRRVQVVLDRARAGVPPDTLMFIRSQPPGCNSLNSSGC